MVDLRRARVSVGATFFIHGFVSGSWATRIPAIKAELRLDDGDLGIALTGLAAGLFIGTRIAGWPVDRAGTRRTIRVTLPLLSAALVSPALASDLVGLTAAFALIGLGSGFLDVVMNTNAVAVEREYRRPIMSGLHGFWSGGLLAGSSLGAGAASIGAGLEVHFGVVAAVLIPTAVLATRSLLPTGGVHATAPIAGELHLAAGARVASVLVLGLIAFSSFAAEGSAADWSAVYVDETVGTGAGFAAVAFAAFSLGMIIARFAGDAVAARLGPAATVRAGALVAAGALGLALAVPSPATAIVGYLLFGVGLAPIVPITFSGAGALDRPGSGTALGWVVTIAYAGSVVGPAVIGFTADAISLRAALLFPVVLALIAAACAGSVSSAPGGDRQR
jgi:MFS family permease